MSLTNTNPVSFGDDGARQVSFCKDQPALNSQPTERKQAPLFAELAGDTCTAAGQVGRGDAPILALCRELLRAGLSPDQALEVFRGSALAVRVRSIGEGAALEVNAKGTGFVPRAVRTASPIRKTGGQA